MQQQKDYELDESPHKLTQELPVKFTIKPLNFNEVILQEEKIERDLNESYFNFCHSRSGRRNDSCLSKFVRKVCKRYIKIDQLFTHLWRQIMPQFIIGVFTIRNNMLSVDKLKKENQLLQSFKKNRKNFYMIIFQEQKEDETNVLEAFEKVSFLGSQGLGISAKVFIQKTFCEKWKIKKHTHIEQYLILFLKYDCFQNLIYFGSLNASDYRNRTHEEIQTYHSHIQQLMDKYERIQQKFIEDYVEKEHKRELGKEFAEQMIFQ